MATASPILRAFHFSVDDVIDSLIEITDLDIPVFDHPTFQKFKDIHDKWGLTIDLYLFFQKEIDGVMRNLTEVRDVRKELREAGNFIKFGAHALDYDHPPYNQTPLELEEVFSKTYAEIKRFAGEDNYSQEVRLHFYSEMYELAQFFSKYGVSSLFSTDRDIGSYRMPPIHAEDLLLRGATLYEKLRFIRTHFRLEFLINDNLSKKQLSDLYEKMRVEHGHVVCYTHECEFSKPEIWDLLSKSAEITYHWE